MLLPPTIEAIRAADQRIRPYALRTPLIESARLSELLGGRVLLKLETLQRVGAFKFRGAYNKISRIDKARHPGGVVAISSGNHALGVADSAALMGLPAVIVMPSDAPAMKIERTRKLGADVVLYDREREDRAVIGERLRAERDAVMVHPFDDPEIIAGQGTAGLEIVEQATAMGVCPDLVLVPCSGGGLLSGVAIAINSGFPGCQIISAEPEGFDDFARSLDSGKRESNARKSGSICDALMSETPGDITFAACSRLAVRGVAVSEADVRAAVRHAFAELKLVVEPGGAVAFAALLSRKVPLNGRTAVVVLSGGNIDPVLFAEIVNGKVETLLAASDSPSGSRPEAAATHRG